MKIHTKTEVYLDFKELEVLLKEKGFIPLDLRISNVMRDREPYGDRDGVVKLVLFKNVEISDIVNDGVDKPAVKPEVVEENPLFATGLIDLDLSIRVLNIFYNNDIKTLGEIKRMTEKELQALDGFGYKSIKEVKELLRSKGLALED
jgi:hypothetical protein